MESDFCKEPEYWNWLARYVVTDSNSRNNLGKEITPSHLEMAIQVYEKAESMGCVTEDLACQQVKLYLQVGKLKRAKELVEKLCTGKLSNAVDLWVFWISIEMRRTSGTSSLPTKADLTSIFGLLKKVLSDTNVSKAERLWRMAFQIFSKQKKYFDKLVDLAVTCLIRDGGSDDGFSLSFAIFELLLQTDGVDCARDKYYEFLANFLVWQIPVLYFIKNA